MASSAIQWSELQDIYKMQQFYESDALCLQEIYNVLKKYNQLERFGISLLYKHFEDRDDELLLETTDIEGRTQVIRLVKKVDYEGKKGNASMPTMVKLVENGGTVSVQNCTYYTINSPRPFHHR